MASITILQRRPTATQLLKEAEKNGTCQKQQHNLPLAQFESENVFLTIRAHDTVVRRLAWILLFFFIISIYAS